MFRTPESLIILLKHLYILKKKRKKFFLFSLSRGDNFHVCLNIKSNPEITINSGVTCDQNPQYPISNKNE